MTTIEIQYRDGRTENRQLPEGTLVIGREVGDIVLHDPLVSGTHGELRVQGDQLIYQDTGSSNGSFDGQGGPLQGPVPLTPGAVVQLGQCRIVVKDMPAAAKPMKGRTMVMGSAPLGGIAPMTAAAGPAFGSPAGAPMPAPAPPPIAAPMAPLQQAATDPAPPMHASAPPPIASPPEPVGPPPATPIPPASPAPSSNVWDMDASPSQSPPPPSEPPATTAEGAGGGFLARVDPIDADPDKPFGRPVTEQAGKGMSQFVDELKARLTFVYQLVRPHIEPLAMTVGIIVVPFALLQLILGFIPALGLLAALLIAPLEGIALTVWVNGVLAQAANQLTGGESLDMARAKATHRGLMVPWTISWLIGAIPGVIAALLMMTIILSPLGMLMIIPAIMLTWALGPAFVVEERRGADAPMRSFRLFKADWLHVLQGMAVLIIGMMPVWIATTILSMIPIVGPLASAAATLVTLPFSTVYAFALFRETKLRLANAGTEVA